MTTSPINSVKELVCRKVAGGRHDLGKGPVRISGGRKVVRKCRYRERLDNINAVPSY